MLPLGTKPILQHIVEELRTAGLEEIIIVSREGKSAIANHFAGENDIRILMKKGAKGPGHSVMFAREFLGDESFLVAFGDAPYRGARVNEFLLQLLNAHESLQASAVLAVARAPLNEIPLRAVVKPEGSLKPGVASPVADLVQKPGPSEAPSNWAVAGRYTFNPAVLDSLADIASRATGEILLVDAIKHMMAQGQRIYALPLGESQHRFDTGSLEGYLRAFRAYADESSHEDWPHCN